MIIGKCALLLLMLDFNGFAISDDKKRLVYHSDLDDIHTAIEELRHAKQALKAEIEQMRNDDKKRLVLHSDLDIQAVIEELRRENQALRVEVEQMKNGQGSTYIRWGRTVCPSNGSETVYSGYTAGSWYDSSGGAAKPICLPQNPSWAYYIDGIQQHGGLVYGTEYETHYNSIDQHAFGKNMLDQDAPCAVCHSSRTATIMIPGSTTCYSGWTQEYTGYLMSDYFGHNAASDYVCVDKDPEAVFHGEADLNGNLFYFVEVSCGSLPCQEYPQGRELACVVCSK